MSHKREAADFQASRYAVFQRSRVGKTGAMSKMHARFEQLAPNQALLLREGYNM